MHDASVDVSGSIVTEVGDGAELTMLSVMDGPAERTHLWQWHTTVGRDARFVGAVVTIGGRVVRIVPSVSYSGPGGSAELLGAFFAEGGQYLEHRIFVDHDAAALHEQRRATRAHSRARARTPSGSATCSCAARRPAPTPTR